MQNNKITQENDSHLITIISYLPVVDDGDGVPPPADNHGADSGPGSLLRIELQDVVICGVGSVATCIVFMCYIITRTVLVTTQIMTSHQGVTVCTCHYNFIVQCGAPQLGPG